MERISLKTKVCYGITSIGDSAFYNLMGSFSLFYLTSVVDLSAIAAGTIIGLGAIWQTVSGAIVGYVSDYTVSRLGKRKPFILFASVFLSLFCILLFINVHLSTFAATLYYGLVMLFFWTAFSTYFIPYLSWGAEIVRNYDERTVLRGFASVFNSIGLFLGMVFPNIIVDVLTTVGLSIDMSWSFVGVICGILAGASIFIGAYNIKDQNELSYGKDSTNSKTRINLNLMKALKELVVHYYELCGLRVIRLLLGASMLYLLGNTFFSANRMYFFTYYMNLSSTTISFILAFPIFTTLLFVPLITRLSNIWGKKNLFLAGLFISSVGMFLFGFITIDSLPLLFANYVFFSIGSTTYWQLMPATLYDVCEVDQLVNKKDRAGLIVSLQSISESLSNAIGFQFLGIILDLVGFDGALTIQCDSALLFIHLFFSSIPAVITILAFILILKFPINRMIHADILNAIESRKKGESINIEKFSSLL